MLKFKKNTSVFILFLLISINIFSQEILYCDNVIINPGFTKTRQSLPIVNNDKNEIMIFLLEKNGIDGLKFNSNYELISNVKYEKPKNKFKTLLGHSFDSNGYHLFFTNKVKNQFFIQSINENTKKSRLLPIKLKSEKFLETISYKNKFYIVTIVKRTSILKLYTFEGNKMTKEMKLDFNESKFSKSRFQKLFHVMLDKNNPPFESNLRIQKIDINNQNPLAITTESNKLYYYDNKIFLSLDNELNNTKLITINLNDYTSKINIFSQPKVDCENRVKIKSNSYLFDDKLYQIKLCKEELSLQILDIKNSNIIKQYRTKSDEELSFKNSSIFQEKSNEYKVFNKRELTNSKQVLRKISGMNIGVSVSRSNNNLELTIGACKIPQQGIPGNYDVKYENKNLTSSLGSINIATSSINIANNSSTMFAYNNYLEKKSVYFKTLLDINSLNQIEGEVLKNGFEKIKNFEGEIKNKIISKTIFKIKNNYIFGYYNKKDKKYYLRNFD